MRPHSPDTSSEPVVEEELSGLAAALAAAQRELTRGDAIDLGRLHRAFEQAETALAAVQPAERAGLAAHVLVVLDELQSLDGGLRREREAVREKLKTVGALQQARSTYARSIG